jgi:N-formylglutamate deformylase
MTMAEISENLIPDVLHALQPEDGIPLVFDSPHSGTVFPDDFSCNATDWQLRMNRDIFVDELFAHVTEQGAGLLCALFPRVFVDPNRNAGEIDPSMLAEPWPEPLKQTRKTRVGMGVIRKYIVKGVLMHDRPLPVEEVRSWLETYHAPYHQTLAEMLDRAHRRHGAVWHVNCHSTKSMGAAMNIDEGERRADVILSDLDGKTTDPDFIGFAAECFQAKGYSLSMNYPFRGAELIHRFGDPGNDRHSIQIEINRALYLDETTYEKSVAFEAFRQDLREVTARLADFVRDRASDKQRPDA